MVRKLLISLALLLFLLQPAAAQTSNDDLTLDEGETTEDVPDPFAGDDPTKAEADAAFDSAMQEAEQREEDAALAPVSAPNQCISRDANDVQITPRNCIFLEEPIGGRPGYDLFIVTCSEDTGCVTSLWNGGAIPPNARGPLQAVLSFEPGREYQGPFGLLYNYLGLVYNYMSGLIVAVAILFVVIGGIQMTTSAGDQGKFQNGRDNIIKALVGLVLWFSASLILYTINPTFFTFLN